MYYKVSKETKSKTIIQITAYTIRRFQVHTLMCFALHEKFNRRKFPTDKNYDQINHFKFDENHVHFILTRSKTQRFISIECVVKNAAQNVCAESCVCVCAYFSHLPRFMSLEHFACKIHLISFRFVFRYRFSDTAIETATDAKHK